MSNSPILPFALAKAYTDGKIAEIISSGEGGSAVNSVNSKIGTVVLDGRDLNVDNSAQTQKTIAAELVDLNNAVQDVIVISDTQPQNSSNEVWIRETENENIVVPTQSEFTTALNQVNSALSDLGSSLGPKEATNTATEAHAAGELFVLGNTLMVALSAIAVGDTITTEGGSPNAAVTTISAKMIKDVQVAGTSVVSNGTADIPIAGTSNFGVMKVYGGYGFFIDNGYLKFSAASDSAIKAGSSNTYPLTPANEQTAAFYGLAKAAGNTDQSSSANAVGTYTEDALSKISQMLDAPVSVSGTTPSITAKAGVRYVCGECSTLTIAPPASGDIEVIFESGSTATVLTITPPTGVTAVKWAGGFDPTSLDADTVYDVIITDGKYGVAASWA